MKDCIVIALFGGKGERFGLSKPKQFALLGEEPMLLVTLRAYDAIDCVREIVVVSEPNTLREAASLVFDAEIEKVTSVIAGGPRRQDSARNALEDLRERGIKDEDIVLIVDGDRPCVQERFVRECVDAVEPGVGAVTAIPSTDSLLLGEGSFVGSYLDRNQVYRVQTPQGFCFGDIYEAHATLKDEDFTDDASMLIRLGKEVRIIQGSPSNIKITTPEDIGVYEQWNRNDT